MFLIEKTLKKNIMCYTIIRAIIIEYRRALIMKNLKTFIIIFIFVFMLSGCYKSETTLRINSDRSVDLDAKILVDDNFNETPYMNNMSSYNSRNIKIQRINESKYNGYKITKSYGSIDDISYEDDVKIELSKFFDADFNHLDLIQLQILHLVYYFHL